MTTRCEMEFTVTSRLIGSHFAKKEKGQPAKVVANSWHKQVQIHWIHTPAYLQFVYCLN